MNIDLKKIESGKDTNIGILLYIKKYISVDVEIGKIESGNDTDITLNSYFQNSPDYKKLIKRIEEVKERVLELAKIENESTRHVFECKYLSELEQSEISFKKGALRLAETFLQIESNSIRLQQAKSLFEQGFIFEADEILLESDLSSDQDGLIVQMAYLKSRNINLLYKINQIIQIHQS